MTGEPADPEYVVEYEGKKVLLCCDKCRKIWNKNPKYIIKAVGDLLPQFAGQEEKLGLEKIELLEQRWCPIHADVLVTPDSPSVEFHGRKIYFSDKKAMEEWGKDPDAHAAAAVKAGLLPQLEPNKDKKDQKE